MPPALVQLNASALGEAGVALPTTVDPSSDMWYAQLLSAPPARSPRPIKLAAKRDPAAGNRSNTLTANRLRHT